jgi:hypothetical protein
MGKKNRASQPANTPKEKDVRDDPSSIPGLPGYRTRDGRSGYDPIDTRTEAAHTASVFVRDLFTRKLRIRNPIFLLLSGLLGLALIIPFLLAILELLNGHLVPLGTWITFLIPGIIGLAVLLNFIKSLIGIKR